MQRTDHRALSRPPWRPAGARPPPQPPHHQSCSPWSLRSSPAASHASCQAFPMRAPRSPWNDGLTSAPPIQPASWESGDPRPFGARAWNDPVHACPSRAASLCHGAGSPWAWLGRDAAGRAAPVCKGGWGEGGEETAARGRRRVISGGAGTARSIEVLPEGPQGSGGTGLTPKGTASPRGGGQTWVVGCAAWAVGFRGEGIVRKEPGAHGSVCKRG